MSDRPSPWHPGWVPPVSENMDYSDSYSETRPVPPPAPPETKSSRKKRSPLIGFFAIGAVAGILLATVPPIIDDYLSSEIRS